MTSGCPTTRPMDLREKSKAAGALVAEMNAAGVLIFAGHQLSFS